MTETIYRFVRGWSEEDFPSYVSQDKIVELNSILPGGFEFHIEYYNGDRHVNMYEYIGDFSDGELVELRNK